MRSLRPTPTLALSFASVGFVSGCGLAQFRIPGLDSMGAFAGALLLSIATFIWFREDTHQRFFRRSTILNVAFIGLTLVILPYYLVKSRGLTAGLIAIGGAVSIYLLYGFAAFIGAVLIKIIGA